MLVFISICSICCLGSYVYRLYDLRLQNTNQWASFDTIVLKGLYHEFLASEKMPHRKHMLKKWYTFATKDGTSVIFRGPVPQTHL